MVSWRTDLTRQSPGGKNAIFAGTAVLPGGQEAPFVRKAQLTAEGVLGLLSHGFKKTRDGQRFQAAVPALELQGFQSAFPTAQAHDLRVQSEGYVLPLFQGIHQDGVAPEGGPPGG